MEDDLKNNAIATEDDYKLAVEKSIEEDTDRIDSAYEDKQITNTRKLNEEFKDTTELQLLKMDKEWKPEYEEVYQQSKKIDDDEELGYMADVGLQAVGGLRDAAIALAKLGGELGEIIALPIAKPLAAALDQDLGELKEKRMDEISGVAEVQESERFELRALRGLVQFAAPYAAMGKVTKVKDMKGFKQAAEQFGRGITTMFVAFDEQEKRAFEVIKELGVDNSFVDWMADRTDEPALESRAKLALEDVLIGGPLGVVVSQAMKAGGRTAKELSDATFGLFKYIKEARVAKDSADTLKPEAKKLAKNLTANKTIISDIASDKRTAKITTDVKNKKTKTELTDDLRPDKKIISVQETRNKAKVIAPLTESMKKGELDRVLTDKQVSKLSAITQAQTDLYNDTRKLAVNLSERLKLGDTTARHDFLENIYDGVLIPHAKAQDAFSELSRSLGARSKETSVLVANKIKANISKLGSKELDGMIDVFSKIEDPNQVGILLDNIFRNPESIKPDGGFIRFLEKSFQGAILSSPDTWLRDQIGSTVYAVTVKGPIDLISSAIGSVRQVAFGSEAERRLATESAIFFKEFGAGVVDGLRYIGKAAKQNNFNPKSTIGEIGGALERLKLSNVNRFGYDKNFKITNEDTVRKGASYLARKTGIINKDLPKGHPVELIAKSWEAIYGTSIRAMRTSDDVRRNLYDRGISRGAAYRKAVHEGLGGGDLEKRVNELLELPIDKIGENIDVMSTDGMKQYLALIKEVGAVEASKRFSIAKESVNGSKVLTFTDKASVATQKLSELAKVVPGSGLVVPFLHTLDRLTRRGIELSPAELANPWLYKAIQAGGKEADDALAKVAFSSSVFLGAFYLASENKLTGNGPSDPQENKAWRDSNMKPKSILVGDEWVDISPLGPFATPFLMASNIRENFATMPHEFEGSLDKDSILNDMMKSIMGTGEALMSSHYMTSIAGIFEAARNEDGDGVKRYISNIATAITVPAFVARFREREELQSPQNFIERVQAKAGFEVRAKRNLFGDILKVEDRVSPLIPFRKKPAKMEEWHRKLVESNAVPRTPGLKISVKGFDGRGKRLTIASGIEITIAQREELLSIIAVQKSIYGEYTAKDAIKALINGDIAKGYWDSLPSVKRVSPREGDPNLPTRRQVVSEIYNTALDAAIEVLIESNPEIGVRAMEKRLLERVSSGTTPLMQGVVNLQRELAEQE